MRQAELAERRVEHRPHVIGVGARQRLAAQQIAAVRIGQRQRLATGAVAGQEPALEVDAPHVVGRAAMRQTARSRAGCGGAACASPSSPSRSNSAPIVLAAGHAVRGAVPLKTGPHLHRSPGRMRPAHRNAALGDLLRHRLRMMQRCPRAIEQTLNARLPDSAQAICSRSSGSPRSAGTPPQTPRPAPQPPSQSASAHPSAQVSLHPIGKALLADQLTCYPCRRSILLPM